MEEEKQVTVQVVGRASRLPPGRLALKPTDEGETPNVAGETPAPLPEKSRKQESRLRTSGVARVVRVGDDRRTSHPGSSNHPPDRRAGLTGASPLPRRSTLLKKQGTTASLRRGSGEARATVGCLVGGTGGRRLDCLRCHARFGCVAETRKTGKGPAGAPLGA